MTKQVLVTIESLHKENSSKLRLMKQILSAHGLKGIACVDINPLYKMMGELSSDSILKMSQELLCDTVVENYSLDAVPPDEHTYFVDVMYKPGVTDTIGESVLKASEDLDVAGLKEVHSGIRYQFVNKDRNRQNESNSTEKVLEKFTSKELLNPLIQECKIVKR